MCLCEPVCVCVWERKFDDRLFFLITSPNYIQNSNPLCKYLHFEIYWPSSIMMRQKLMTGVSDEDRWWMGADLWPPLIRYGCSNWLAVFSINRHYRPLYQPAPLAALLFLEAPGSSRSPVLTLTVLQVFSRALSSCHIGKKRGLDINF